MALIIGVTERADIPLNAWGFKVAIEGGIKQMKNKKTMNRDIFDFFKNKYIKPAKKNGASTK